MLPGGILLLTSSAARPIESLLRKRKEKYRRCAGVLIDPEPRRASGHEAYVLLTVDFIRDDAAADRAAGVEAVKDITRLGIENDEIASSLSAEDNITRSGRYRGHHRAVSHPCEVSASCTRGLRKRMRLLFGFEDNFPRQPRAHHFTDLRAVLVSLHDLFVAAGELLEQCVSFGFVCLQRGQILEFDHQH
jgi:hypothetical protein